MYLTINQAADTSDFHGDLMAGIDARREAVNRLPATASLLEEAVFTGAMEPRDEETAVALMWAEGEVAS